MRNMRLVMMAALLAAYVGASAQYAVTVLHPPGKAGSYARGIQGSTQVGSSLDTVNGYRAMLWNGTAQSAVDLHPSDRYLWSGAMDVWGDTQVGFVVRIAAGSPVHAARWSGTAESFVDINPAGFSESAANAIDGDSIVGEGQSDTWRALRWRGGVVEDLHPAGFTTSTATAVSGSGVAGYGRPSEALSLFTHALFWGGAGGGVVDLNPDGFEASEALGIDEESQVGQVAVGQEGLQHAALWRVTSASFVDLNPSGFAYSTAQDVAGGMQVGYGWGAATGDQEHALLWRGDPSSVIDLQSYVNLPQIVSSQATAIDSNGVIAGFVVDASGYGQAVIWTPVPEPTPALILGILIVATAFRSSRR